MWRQLHLAYETIDLREHLSQILYRSNKIKNLNEDFKRIYQVL